MSSLTIAKLLKIWPEAQLLQGDEQKTIANIASDSRSPLSNKAFIALKGERFDGHDYLSQALSQGAAALVISQSSRLNSQLKKLAAAQDCALIQVPDTWKAFFAFARQCREEYTKPVICVTGSVGKTSSRRMISCALSASGKVVETAANLNNEIGISQTLFKLLDSESECAIIEMGIDEVGEMARETRLAQPDIAVITNIGFSHIDHFKNQQILLREKTSILNGLRPNGALVIPFNDELLRHYALFHGLAPHLNLYFYGLVEDYQSDYRNLFPKQTKWIIGGARYCPQAEDLQPQEPQQTADPVKLDLHMEQQFTVNVYAGSKDEEQESWQSEQEIPLRLNLAGKHHAQNACLALTVALALGKDLPQAAQALSGYIGVAGRENLIKVGNSLLIDDSYNAASLSFNAALETASYLRAQNPALKRLIAVFASINELGEYSEAEHRKVGKSIAEHQVDVIYLLGHGAQAMAEGYFAEIAAQGAQPGCLIICEDKKSLAAKMLEDLQDFDLLLFKGSHSFALNELVEQVCEELNYRMEMAE